jgi:hypothetical protein
VVGDVPEARSIDAEWELAFPPDRGAPARVKLPKLIDWTSSDDPGVRYFSGTATYRTDFRIAESELERPGAVYLAEAELGRAKTIHLDLGVVKDVAKVIVNGREAGILWKEPYRIDIRPYVKAGANELEIDVTNTWNNRLVGDARGDAGEPVTRTNIAGKFNARTPLLSSGLIGPVSLQFPVETTSKLTR